MNPSLKLWQSRLAVFSAGLAGFAIPVSTALENIAVSLLLLTFVLIPPLWREIPKVLREPFVLACLIFYTVLVASAIYSSLEYSSATRMLLKMREYLLAPLLFAIFLHLPARRKLLLWFAIGVALSVVISVGLAILSPDAFLPGLKKANSIFEATRGDWAIFRTHTYHNFFAMMLLVGLLILKLLRVLPRFCDRYLWIAITVCLVDILFLVQGRSVQFVLLPVVALVLFLWNRRTGSLLTLFAIALLPVLYFGSSNIRDNLEKINSDLAAYQNGKIETSVGYRLDFYKNSLALIQENPWLGHGTGSFASEYRRLTGYSEGDLAAVNPHNDYFWLGVESGLLGIAALLGVIAAMIVHARRRAKPEQWMAISLAVSMALITLGNSFFTDNISRTAFVLLACALLAGDSFKYVANKQDGGVA